MTYTPIKRLIDLIVATGLALIFLPIWIIVPILIYLDSGTPIIFKHRRVGKDGHDFYLYKFRSMVKNADELLHQKDSALLAKFKAGDWKIQNDPRITPLGRILRSLTIDEFPQLYNVFKGEMSMVGPRAYVRKELEEQTKRYPETNAYRDIILTIKPGITGPWQTSGRNEVPFVQRAKMDSEYANTQSFLTDLKILLKTPKAMISKW